MSVKIFPTLKNYKKEYLPKDILSGITTWQRIQFQSSWRGMHRSQVFRRCMDFMDLFCRSCYLPCSQLQNSLFGVDVAPAYCRSCTGNTLSDGRISPHCSMYHWLHCLQDSRYESLVFYMQIRLLILSQHRLWVDLSVVLRWQLLWWIQTSEARRELEEFIELAEHIFQ